MVPACELQNFTPSVTALSSASTAFAGTALPKMLTGVCAHATELTSNELTESAAESRTSRSVRRRGLRASESCRSPARPGPVRRTELTRVSIVPVPLTAKRPPAQAAQLTCASRDSRTAQCCGTVRDKMTLSLQIIPSPVSGVKSVTRRELRVYFLTQCLECCVNVPHPSGTTKKYFCRADGR